MKIPGSLFLLLLVVFSACAKGHSKRNVSEVIDDNVIAVKLKTVYMKDKVVDNSDIKIKVRKGVVQLSGVVDSQNEINRAIELAEKQRGVKEVKAYLVLKDIGELRSEDSDSSIKTTSKKKKNKQNNDGGLAEKDLTEFESGGSDVSITNVTE